MLQYWSEGLVSTLCPMPRLFSFRVINKTRSCLHHKCWIYWPFTACDIARCIRLHVTVYINHGVRQYAICRDGPEKNGGHINSAQMTHLKCLHRLVKGLHEPYQAILSASMGNGAINIAGWRVSLKYQTSKLPKWANHLIFWHLFFLFLSHASSITIEAITTIQTWKKKQHKSLGTALTTYHGQSIQIILQWFSRTLMLIGASLSKPHTSMTALRTRVSIHPSDYLWTDHLLEILNLRIYKICTCMCALQI